MYTDLRQFDMAKQYLTPGRGGRRAGGDGGGGGELLSKQAEWAKDTNDTNDPHTAW